MNTSFLPRVVFLLALLAASARAGVTLTATQVPAGTLHPGDSFAIELTWAGDTPVAAADYTVNLGGDGLLFTNRVFDAAIGLADTAPLPGPAVATNAIFATWFESAGFLGRDVRLEFKIPSTYAGPGALPVTLSVDAVQDVLAQAIAFTATGFTLHIALPTVTTTFQAGDGKLSAADYADAQINQAAASAGMAVGGGVTTTISIKEDPSGTDDRIGLFGFFNLFGPGASQIPPGATIVSASLRLVCANDGGRIQDVYVVDRAWTETTVTWNGFFSNNSTPGPAEFGTLLTSVGPLVANQAYTLDVTAAVQVWSDQPASNFGLLFDSNGTGGGVANDPSLWATSEHATATSRPLLTVEYRTGATPSPYEEWMSGFASLDAGQRLPGADPDGDGAVNLVEFAHMGSPTNPAQRGLMHTYHDAGADSLALVAAVRRGASFGTATNNGQVAVIDGVDYRVSGATALPVFTSGVQHAGFADTPPAGSGLPALTGQDWRYHTFRLAPANRGYLRVDVGEAP